MSELFNSSTKIKHGLFGHQNNIFHIKPYYDKQVFKLAFQTNGAVYIELTPWTGGSGGTSYRHNSRSSMICNV